MKQGRAIGKRVIQAMEILERLGVARYTEVWAEMTDVCDRENASKYCARAVEYGLAVKVKKDKPVTYRVVPNWREYLVAPPPKAAVPRVNSIWQYAEMSA